MRQILFRGKRSGEFWGGNWAYGSLTCYEPLSCNETERFYITDFGLMERCAVEEKTIGQYTGLRDKSGTKIFEGDIVDIVYDGLRNIFVVVWDADELDFKATNGTVRYGAGGFQYLPCCEYIKVIGNIYDNPEMLNRSPQSPHS